VIDRVEPCRVEGRIIAYLVHITGGGFCLCGADDTLTLPVYLYSPEGECDPQDPGCKAIVNTIAQTTVTLAAMTAGIDPPLTEYRTELALRESLWQDLLAGRLPPGNSRARAVGSDPQQMALPMTSAWHQGAPYNDSCPMGDGGRSLVGCAATAMAQIMRFWQWPPSGSGSGSYTWDGDQSCGGNVGGGTLSASYSDPYDWQNMPDNCTGGCTTAQQNALAELCNEIGVAVSMDYGHCGSGTPLYLFVAGANPLVTIFRYDSDAAYNSDFEPPLTDAETIMAEIQWFRPVEIGGCLNNGGDAHYWVVLGYNSATNPPQFLMNMGWGGANAWSTWDGVANTCHNYITGIAPDDSVRFVGGTAAGDGSPDSPHGSIEDAVQQAPDGATLVFKAGSDNTVSSSPLVINRPLTLKGYNAVIR
jgi:hypothetical protein